MMNRKIYSLVLLVFAWIFFAPRFGNVVLPLHTPPAANHGQVSIKNTVAVQRQSSNIDSQRKDNHRIASPIRIKALDNAFSAALPPVILLQSFYEHAIAVNYNDYNCHIVFHSRSTSLLRGPPQV